MSNEVPVSQAELRPPGNPAATGLPLTMIEDILLRIVVADGRQSVTKVAERMHCVPGMLDGVVSALRDRSLIEYQGMDGRTYLIAATEAGREQSRRRSEECRYAGPLPVPLDLYSRVVRAQRPNLYLDRDTLTRAYSDLVVSAELIDQLGPAICGDGAMFLYGPPGTGKSSLAERMIRAYGDTVLVPHCIEASGQVITVFDPTLHEPLEEQPAALDSRWIVCKRPAVIAGGELHGAMLDLNLDTEVGTYLAPLQLKANNGILVIDDFGRQIMTPEELLNRWIVPLDRQIDYLTLAGRKLAVPFEVKVVLSTNLDPASLGDEAFFRRIHNKVYVGCLDDEQFDWVLARVASAKRVELTEDAAAHLRRRARAAGDGELRAYLPGVVCKLALAICRYENTAPKLSPALVDRVLDLYFARTDARSAKPADLPGGHAAPGALPSASHYEHDAALSGVAP